MKRTGRINKKNCLWKGRDDLHARFPTREAQRRELARIVVAWAKRNPDTVPVHATDLLEKALTDAFC